MSQKFVIDRSVSLVGSTRETTDEGYLRVQGRVARAGIQQYLAHELGLDGNHVVNVFRPPEEVFHADSLASYAHKDVTDDHPGDLVTCDSYRMHSVGHVTDAGTRDEQDWITVPMLIKHGDSIAKVRDGKAELSAGYLAEYVAETGTHDGVPYEFVQRNIRINHVAIVDAARAGTMARIFDAKPPALKGETMTRKVVLDSKRKISVTLDEDTAAVVESVIENLEEDKAEAETRAAEAQAEVEKKDAQIDALQEKVDAMSDESVMDARIKEALAVRDSAAKIIKAFDAKGETRPLEIKRAVMAQKFPTRDWQSKSAAYIEAAFDQAAEEEADDKNEKFASDMRRVHDGRATNDGSKAYSEFLKGGRA